MPGQAQKFASEPFFKRASSGGPILSGVPAPISGRALDNIGATTILKPTANTPTNMLYMSRKPASAPGSQAVMPPTQAPTETPWSQVAARTGPPVNLAGSEPGYQPPGDSDINQYTIGLDQVAESWKTPETWNEGLGIPLWDMANQQDSTNQSLSVARTGSLTPGNVPISTGSESHNIWKQAVLAEAHERGDLLTNGILYQNAINQGPSSRDGQRILAQINRKTGNTPRRLTSEEKKNPFGTLTGLIPGTAGYEKYMEQSGVLPPGSQSSPGVTPVPTSGTTTGGTTTGSGLTTPPPTGTTTSSGLTNPPPTGTTTAPEESVTPEGMDLEVSNALHNISNNLSGTGNKAAADALDAGILIAEDAFKKGEIGEDKYYKMIDEEIDKMIKEIGDRDAEFGKIVNETLRTGQSQVDRASGRKDVKSKEILRSYEAEQARLNARNIRSGLGRGSTALRPGLARLQEDRARALAENRAEYFDAVTAAEKSRDDAYLQSLVKKAESTYPIEDQLRAFRARRLDPQRQKILNPTDILNINQSLIPDPNNL